jgi:aspartyl-tRNA(Asn)/glutamyl-tRNA(Gln) amidotransferase subunit C
MPEPARLTREQVEHVARLARLALTDAEVDAFTGQLATILAHADDVASLDIDDVPPTAHPLPIVNVLRADSERPPLDRGEVLDAAPDTADGRFRVPRIIGEPA